MQPRCVLHARRGRTQGQGIPRVLGRAALPLLVARTEVVLRGRTPQRASFFLGPSPSSRHPLPFSMPLHAPCPCKWHTARFCCASVCSCLTAISHHSAVSPTCPYAAHRPVIATPPEVVQRIRVPSAAAFRSQPTACFASLRTPRRRGLVERRPRLARELQQPVHLRWTGLLPSRAGCAWGSALPASEGASSSGFEFALRGGVLVNISRQHLFVVESFKILLEESYDDSL